MPTLWIHAGSPKTGSTSLQTFWKDNEDLLKERHNIRIPVTSRRDRNFHIRHDGTFLFSKRCKPILQQFIQELNDHPDSDFILSDESIGNGMRLMAPELVGLLKEGCPGFDIKVVVYLRRLDDGLKSLFNQKVKSFVEAKPDIEDKKIFILQHDYNSFVQKRLPSPGGVPGHARFIAQSQQLFGLENTCIRMYGKGFLHNNDVVDDFFSILGIDTSQGFVRPVRRNVSPSQRIIPFFMGKGLPEGMPYQYRKRLMGLAADTFSFVNTVDSSQVEAALGEEIDRLDELHRAYARATGDNAANYKDLYKDRPLEVNTKELECDRYTLYLIRQLNYTYGELVQIRRDVAEMKRNQLGPLLARFVRNTVAKLQKLYTEKFHK